MTQEQAYKNLQRRVRNVHLRYCGLSLYFNWIRTFFYTLLVAGLVAGIFKVFPSILQPFDRWIPIWILWLSFPLSLGITWLRRGSIKRTAILTDKHLHLKEKISSALELGTLKEIPDVDREWNLAILQDALHATERVNLNHAFPLTNPRELRWIWIPVIVFFLTVYVIPPLDYFGGKKQAQAETIDQKLVQKEIQKLMQRQLVLERQAKEKDTKVAAEISKQIKELANDLSKGKIERRDALAKLSSLEQEWEKRQEQMKSMQMAMEQPLSSGMKPKMTNELVEALEKSDFEKAAQALSKLEKQLKMGNLDKEGQKQLSDELKKMASMMNMDTPMAKALQNAGQMLQENEMDAALQPMQMAEMSMMDMKDLLDQMKLLDASLKDLKDAKNALAGKFDDKGKGFGEGEGDGSCFGKGFGEGDGFGPEGVRPWQPGESRGRGNGMGGPGIGRGANAPNQKTDTKMTPDKLKGMFSNAPIQGILPVDGESIKGESVLGIDAAATLEFNQENEEALTKERVPLPLKNQVRQYFEANSETPSEAQSESGNTATSGETNSSSTPGSESDSGSASTGSEETKP